MKKINSFLKITACFPCLFLGLFFHGKAQEKVWTLEDCITYALENNIQIQQNQLSQKLADYDYKQAKYNILPDLNGFASHGYNFGQTIDPFTNQFANTQVQSNSFSISSSVTLFNGFRIVNTIKRTEAQQKSAVATIISTQNLKKQSLSFLKCSGSLSIRGSSPTQRNDLLCLETKLNFS